MSQKQMILASLFTIFLVLFPAFFQITGIIIVIQIAIVLAAGFVLKPGFTLVPTVTNLLVFMIVQYPIFNLTQGSLENIFVTPLLGFNLSYIAAAELMARYLARKNTVKFFDRGKAVILGVCCIVLIGVTYFILLTYIV